METVLDQLGSKLSDLVGEKVVFPMQNEHLALKVYARLCLLYDEDWEFDERGKVPALCKIIHSYLNMVGLGHLCARPADVLERRRLARVWSALLDAVERRHGHAALHRRLRKVLLHQQMKRECRARAEHRAHVQRAAAAAAQRARHASCSSQESDADGRFVRPAPVRSRTVSTSSVASGDSQEEGRPRSRIPRPTHGNRIPTGRQLTRTPSEKPLAATLPAPAVGSPPPPPLRRIASFTPGGARGSGGTPAGARSSGGTPAGARSSGHRAGGGDRTPGSTGKPLRRSHLMVAKNRLSITGNVSYELVASNSLRHSEDGTPEEVTTPDAVGEAATGSSPTLVRKGWAQVNVASPLATAAGGASSEVTAPSPLIDPAAAPSTPDRRASGEPRRRSLVPVAVSHEQVLGKYIEERLSADFHGDHLPRDHIGDGGAESIVKTSAQAAHVTSAHATSETGVEGKVTQPTGPAGTNIPAAENGHSGGQGVTSKPEIDDKIEASREHSLVEEEGKSAVEVLAAENKDIGGQTKTCRNTLSPDHPSSAATGTRPKRRTNRRRKAPKNELLVSTSGDQGLESACSEKTIKAMDNEKVLMKHPDETEETVGDGETVTENTVSNAQTAHSKTSSSARSRHKHSSEEPAESALVPERRAQGRRATRGKHATFNDENQATKTPAAEISKSPGEEDAAAANDGLAEARSSRSASSGRPAPTRRHVGSRRAADERPSADVEETCPAAQAAAARPGRSRRAAAEKAAQALHAQATGRGPSDATDSSPEWQQQQRRPASRATAAAEKTGSRAARSRRQPLRAVENRE